MHRALLLLPVLAFFVLSLVISVIAWGEAGWPEALSAIAGSLSALMAGNGLRAAIKHPLFRASRIRGVAAILLLIAFWLSGGFSVQLSGVDLSGAAWVAIGFFISFLSTTTEFATRLWMLHRFRGS